MKLIQCGTKTFYLLLGVALISAATSSALAQEVSQYDNDAAYLVQWLGEPELSIDGAHIMPTASLRDLYAARSYAPIWTDKNGLNARARIVLTQLENAAQEGLNPDLYMVSNIHRVMGYDNGDAKTRLQVRLSLELLMSQAFLRYASDMQYGFSRSGAGILSASDEELIAPLKKAPEIENVEAYLQSLEPQSSDYVALKSELKHYQEIASHGGWPSFTVGKTIKPGTRDVRVDALQQILLATNDLAPELYSSTNLVYEGDVVNALKHFQQCHGLKADGVLNTATQEELAVPIDERIAQIEVTLERMRGMPHDLGNRYVLVNVPAYQLRAVMGDDQLEMNVIVGKPSTPTPLFNKNITTIMVNPSWGVPAKVAAKEMLPKIRKNANYLINAGYEVSRNGQKIDPSLVDWSSVSTANFSYTLRQKPGAGNALGKVKFLIPDSDDVYLHDTSQHNLFARAERSLSHGCVRLSEPKALTKFVLTHEGWDERKVEATYDSAVSRSVSITPLPVYIVYWTSWVDKEGALHFQRDIYGKDKTLMAKMNTKPMPEENMKLAMQ